MRPDRLPDGCLDALRATPEGSLGRAAAEEIERLRALVGEDRRDDADLPINDEWLREVGFKWHQFDRQPGKHWLLWLGSAFPRRMWTSFEDLGIELASTTTPGEWHCWLRGDTAHRYHRFIHIRHLFTRAEVIALVEALTAKPWNPEHHFYGSVYSEEGAAHIRREDERLDHRLRRQGAKWAEIEKDDTRGQALPAHMEDHERRRREASA